jgi:hypothetical protein
VAITTTREEQGLMEQAAAGPGAVPEPELPLVGGGAGKRHGVVKRDGRNVGPPRGVVQVSKPAQVITLVPYLLGFQPQDGDLVIMGAVPPRGRVTLTLRLDMPARPAPAGQAVQARYAARTLAANGCTIATVVGYGPQEVVAGYAPALRDAARDAGITLYDIVRVHGQRWYSLACREPGCCPAEGTPLALVPDPAIAAAYEWAGVRVLASRDAVAASIAPVTGDEAAAMRAAARRAGRRADRLARREDQPGRRSVRSPVVISGTRAVLAAIRAYQNGGAITSPDQIAWLARVLAEREVRGAAWYRMDPGHRDAHQRLWTDVTRRAQPGLVVTPACLLALVAWQGGYGPLALLALDRAETDCPGHDLARLLRPPIEAGAPPPGSPPRIQPWLESGRP